MSGQVKHAAAASPATEAIAVVTRQIKARPVLFSGYLLGILAAVLGTGFSVSESALANYQDSMHAASRTTDHHLQAARRDLMTADQQYFF